MKKLFTGGTLLLILFGTSCKKESNPTPPKPPTPAEDTRVRRYSYDYNGKTDYYTYTYDAQKRLDSVYYLYSNGNGGKYHFQYTATGFERPDISYLTDNADRITLQLVPVNHEQSKGFYNAAGQLDYVVTLNTYNSKEDQRRWYAWDGDNNLLRESRVSVTFDTAGRRLIRDSSVTLYSNFTALNTVGPKAFGFNHFGTTPVNAFRGSPDGIQGSKMLPATQNQTYYRFATPRLNPAAYTSLEDAATLNYRFTKDAKGRIQTIVFDYENKPVTYGYEYYD